VEIIIKNILIIIFQLTFKEGEKVFVTKTFIAYPQPLSIYWSLHTPNNPNLRLNLGEELPRFKALELQEVEPNK